MDYEKVLNERIKDGTYSLAEAQCIYDYAINLKKQKLPVIFDRKHLALYLETTDYFLKNITWRDNIDYHYNEFSIPKRSGEKRVINAPKERLKSIQNWICKNILENVEVSCAAKAYIKGLSIVDNAKYHIKKKYILKLDFKDFFPNIKFEKIYSIFHNLGYTKEVSYILTKLCTYKNALAQGAPTSPYISNVCCKNLDNRILKYCQYHGMCYTRYADDITISSDDEITEEDKAILYEIISDEGFILNVDKTKELSVKQRHYITGVVVNNKLNVLKKIRNNLRQEIYYCKKFGVNNHLERQGKVYSFYKEHLYGMAYYILMINKEKGKKFLNELDEIQWDY